MTHPDALGNMMFLRQILYLLCTATLALSGIESRVQKAIVDDHETWYRVVIGPKKGMAQAQTVLSQLKASGIEARMIQQK